jgi:glutaredoxin
MNSNPRYRNFCHAKWIVVAVIFVGCVVGQAARGFAQPSSHSSDKRDVVVELFYRGDSDQSLSALRFLNELSVRRPGIQVKAYDVLNDRNQLKRLWQLSKRFGYERAGAPTFYLCNSLKVGFQDKQKSGAQVESLLNIKAFIRQGCKHCEEGRRFLDAMVQRWPAIRVEYFDVMADMNARHEVQRLANQYRVTIPSFPCIKVAGRLVVGYQTDQTTGAKIEDYFKDRSVDFPASTSLENKASENRQLQNVEMVENRLLRKETHSFLRQAKNWKHQWAGWAVALGQRMNPSSIALLLFQEANSNQPDHAADQELPEVVPMPDDQSSMDVSLPDDIQFPDDMPFPEEVQLPANAEEGSFVVVEETIDPEHVKVPFLGELSVSRLGLPTFTFLVGLVDGFNPCAMWVLIFLLSVLVNLKDRSKILIVAGTFVVVSGLAYFVFMAAWFNVFKLIGFLRPVQLGLGILALVVGIINVKDFFAFHKGVSLSIPESAKPTIYRRVRNIVSAKNLYAALAGAIFLAIIVNIVELLCTAGLPALYTQVLSMQGLSDWANYGYLGLYICAYMLDDTLLVGIVVVTLSHRRLQESEGRWLKLASGVVILLLGVVMIFRPEMLV